VRVAWAISFHLNRRSREAWPGIPTLCNLTGYSRRQVIRALEQLEEQKHIIVHRTPGRPNHYEPVLQPCLPCHPTRDITMALGGDIAMAPEPLNEPLSEPLPYGRGFAPPKDTTNDSDKSEGRGSRGSDGSTVTPSDNPLTQSKPEISEEQRQRIRERFGALHSELLAGLDIPPRRRQNGEAA
jgi:hypothetical protein